VHQNAILRLLHEVASGAEGRIAFEKPAPVSCRHKEAGVITQETLTDYIRRVMPDAAVSMIDRTGTMDHLKVVVVSDAFQGKNLLDRHRLIYQALDAPMKDGRIHALELTAKTKDES
jgi:stress-induced morphogen